MEGGPVSPYITINLISGIYLVMVSYILLKKQGLSPVRIITLSVFLGAAYVAGSRLLYSVIYFEDTIREPLKILEPGMIGFSMYGGLILVFVSWLIISKRWAMSKCVQDTLMPHFFIALAGAKLACFINGCCYGKPTDLFFGVMFKRAELHPFSRLFMFGDLGRMLFKDPLVPGHPTQLYEMFFTLLSAVVAYALVKKKAADGVMIFTPGRYVSFLFRDFPGASQISNIIRGPLVYGLVFSACPSFILRMLFNRTDLKASI